MKKVLVLGATSAVAQAFCKQALQNQTSSQHEFYLVGRSQTHLETIASDLKVRGAKIVHIHAMDLNLCSQHEELIKTVLTQLHSLDWVLVAHGILGEQRFAEHNSLQMLNILNTNFISQASLLNPIANIMEEQGFGVIAVLSSVAGDRGRRSNYIYGSAKAAISTYLSGLRVRLYKSNVSVITIKMGFVDTPMTSQFKKGPLWAKPEQIAEKLVPLMENNTNGEIYLPFFWKYIMFIIRSIPSLIFNKLDFL